MLNRKAVCRLAALLTLSLLALLATACGSDPAPQEGSPQAETTSTDPLATAAAQATAIVQQAQATAMILQAQTEAEATLQSAAQTGQADQPGATGAQADATGQAMEQQPGPTATATPEIPIEVLSVNMAADGGMIQVRFLAPAEVADRWLQTDVYIVDEATGAEYREIPVMPRVGPLFGKPARDGQPGYFMLVNGPQPLQSGATVTVVLKNHVEEGITVH